MKMRELPQNWGMYLQELDEDKFAMTMIDMEVFKIAPIKEYGLKAKFVVYYQIPTENGLPSSIEVSTLWRLEDAIIEVTDEFNVINVGVTECNNSSNFLMYAMETEELEQVKKALVMMLNDEFKNYQYSFSFDEDKKWVDYYAFEPNECELQELFNNKALKEMEKEGCDLSKECNIVHWAYFKTEELAKSFVERAKFENFKLTAFDLIGPEEYQYEDFLYRVGISREDIPNEIHEITFLLLYYADDYDGHYFGINKKYSKDS